MAKGLGSPDSNNIIDFAQAKAKIEERRAEAEKAKELETRYAEIRNRGPRPEDLEKPINRDPTIDISSTNGAINNTLSQE